LEEKPPAGRRGLVLPGAAERYSDPIRGLGVGGGVAVEEAGLVAGAVGESRSRVKSWA